MGERLRIDGGLIADGSGTAPFLGSVLIENDRIIEVTREQPVGEAHVLDAEGRCVAPGFVDVHTHSDLSAFVDPWLRSALRQGVTTVVVGNCGSSAWPEAGVAELRALTGIGDGTPELAPGVRGYLEAVAATRPAVNLATLVGHGAIRSQVVGTDRRPPTARELTSMRSLLREALDAGALGMSTGLVYVPGMYADTEELVGLTSELAGTGGIYASHIRGEGTMLFEALAEAVGIGERAEVPVHVSHLKLEGASAWGRREEALGLLDDAGATADQYPYTAWESELWSLLPPWAPPSRLELLLRSAADRAHLRATVELGERGWQSSVEGVGWDRIVVSSHAADRAVLGRSLAALAEAAGTDPASVTFELLRADPSTGVIGHAMREEDVRAICARPEVFVASDSTAMSPEGPLGSDPLHPRTYGTFPRVLGPLVRDGVLSLAAAVRKMTALPAARFGLRERGELRAGAIADVVVFDPATIADEATFEAPHRFPIGVDRVLVSGRLAWSRSGGDGERAGRVLRRSPT